MPMRAHVGVRRMPLRALLILLGLFLTSGAAASAAGSELREPLARLGPTRQGATTALLPSGNRNSLDDEAVGTGGSSSLPQSGPGVITRLLGSWPLAEASSSRFLGLPQPAKAAYRARAPPSA